MPWPAHLTAAGAVALLVYTACGTSTAPILVEGDPCTTEHSCGDSNLICDDGFCYLVILTPCTSNAQGGTGTGGTGETCDTDAGLCILGGAVCPCPSECLCSCDADGTCT